MKKILTLMMAAALMIGFTACEKGDDGPGGNESNIFQVGNKTYTIGAACCYWGNEDGYVYYDMWFANKQLWNDNGNWPDLDDTFNPNGFEINVYELYADDDTDTPGKIKDGTYTFLDDYGDLKHDGSSDYGLYDENGVFDNDYIEFGQNNVSESKLVIKVKNISGNIYEITATGGVDEDGNAINIYYKGEVDMFED